MEIRKPVTSLDSAKKEIRTNVIGGSIWMAASIVLLIIVPLAVGAKHLTAFLVFGVIHALLGLWCLLLGIKKARELRLKERDQAGQDSNGQTMKGQATKAQSPAGRTTSGQALAGQSAREQAPKGRMERYKVEWLWENACEVYCKNHGKNPAELSDEENEEIYDLAGNDAALLVTWVILHDFFVAEDEDMEKSFEEVKNKELTGIDFLGGECDYKLSRSDFSEEIIGFIDDYFAYDGAHGCGDFEEDYKTFVTEDLKKELYAVRYDWEEYEAFKDYIDRAYQKYLTSN